MDIDKRINQANGRLRAARIKVAIERRGSTLSLRATLPAKEPGRKPYRQKIALGVKATPAGLQFAERRARELANDLDGDRFTWADWLELEEAESSSGLSCQQWIEQFETDYWNRRSRDQQTETTWRTDYRVIFNKLPGDEMLSPELLLRVISGIPPDSRQRKRAVQVCSALAKFAGLQVDFSTLMGAYSRKRVNPRYLPTDAAIAEARDSITNEAWRWVFGVIAAYGLRPHEAFHLDLSEFPVVAVGDATKTGERITYPLYPEWAEAWELDNRKLPNFQKEHSNAVLGTNVSDAFRRRNIPFHAYDLRHCYARRCFEFSLPPDLAAGLMGHSVQIHINTYRAWIDRATYRRAYDALINRSDAPQAPTLLVAEMGYEVRRKG